jgi:acyl-CoA thioesterase II
VAAAIADLLAILDLEPLEVNIFRGRSPQVGWQRVFGGQVIGQALVAACRTVDVAGRPPHSMHAYFLLAGDPKIPIVYEVERVRDGKSFTTRRVTALQHGHAIFITSVSFHRDEGGFSHQAKMPDVPTPEELPSEAAIKERVLPLMPEPVRRYYERDRPIELRPVEYDRYLGKKHPDGRFHVWIRATGPLPDEPAIHQCVLAYASDLTLLDAALIPHGRTAFEKGIMAASLDHALWLHRPFRADEWLLYAQVGRSRFLAWADLHPRRYPGRFGGAGRAGARTANGGINPPARALPNCAAQPGLHSTRLGGDPSC